MCPHQEHRNETFLTYIRRIISDLKDDQRFVTITVDETHIKSYFEYKRNTITGIALNQNQAANCELVFMVRMLTCIFKEVAHIVLVHNLDAEFLHNTLKDVVCWLEEIGYRVVSLNPVHVLKCIRNYWINQKNDHVCFYFPGIQTDETQPQRMQIASFATTRELHSKESDQLLKHGYGLSRKAIYHSNIERQNVKLALQIFNNFLSEAWRDLGTKHNLFSFDATATFTEIVIKWWKVVNVKTPWKGKMRQDQFRQPVFSVYNDPKIDFLHTLLTWLDYWRSKGLHKSTLKETHAAFEHTTYGLVELARYSFGSPTPFLERFRLTV
ncbi:hypothetical protein HPB48_025254 [Haemaphysalis longicornis]|uniref:Transposable element P transposase-like RNase H domain-containing protein n=1 Tax=Haemaphysalis longicornis TaxID=44386 RepID=A0A9J6H9L3_HAELO|nr:hypothetical protein HPB48_025254 [Haemaphysalis longicornis]